MTYARQIIIIILNSVVKRDHLAYQRYIFNLKYNRIIENPNNYKDIICKEPYIIFLIII